MNTNTSILLLFVYSLYNSRLRYSKSDHIVISIVNRVVFLQESITQNPKWAMRLRDIQWHYWRSAWAFQFEEIICTVNVFILSDWEFALLLLSFVGRIWSSVFKNESIMKLVNRFWLGTYVISRSFEGWLQFSSMLR